MPNIDDILDRTLIGFSRVGFTTRHLSVDERFPSVAGHHVIVTGATGGIGRAAVERFVANGATVHAVGRSQDKLDKLVTDLGSSVVPHKADLSIMSETSTLADEIIATGESIHGLVNNVGVMVRERRITSEGFELTYATNLLGQYILTERLTQGLAQSLQRIVFVSSGGMLSQALTESNIESGQGEYNGTAAYARTKRGQVVLAEYLDERGGKDPVVTSMHPGWVDTDGVKSSLPTFRTITRPILRNADQGADTIVWLVASPDAANLGGAFVHDRAPRRKHKLARTRVDQSTRTRFLDKLLSDAGPYLR